MMGFKAQTSVMWLWQNDLNLCFRTGKPSGAEMFAEVNPTDIADNVMVDNHLK